MIPLRSPCLKQAATRGFISPLRFSFRRRISTHASFSTNSPFLRNLVDLSEYKHEKPGGGWEIKNNSLLSPTTRYSDLPVQEKVNSSLKTLLIFQAKKHLFLGLLKLCVSLELVRHSYLPLPNLLRPFKLPDVKLTKGAR